MKRLLCLILLLFIALPAHAEPTPQAAPEALAALQGAHPQATVIQSTQWGDTVAALLDDGGVKRLCVLEYREGAWTLAVDNDKALLPDRDFPRLYLDTDDALYWSYSGEPSWAFSSFRIKGEWGAPDLTVRETLDNGNIYETYLCWQAAPGGGYVLRSRSLWDENENRLPGWTEDDGFPAPWLADHAKLATFDASCFPLYVQEEYTGMWPEQPFLRDAAAWLMPTYTYVDAVYVNNTLQFLMDRPDGTRVFVGYARNSFEPALVESTPLPPNTILGVENFTTSLGVNGLCVDIGGSYRSPLLGVRMVMSRNDDLRLGPSCIWRAEEPDTVCIGVNPWYNIVDIEWDTLPQTWEEAVDAVSGKGFAVVTNPDPADRLHLRTRPEKGAPSLGKYYSGTPVRVLEMRGDWAQVDVFGQSGWMMTKYLSFHEPYIASLSAMPKLFFREGCAVLYHQPDEYAASEPIFNDYGMRIIGVIGDEWVHVWFPQTDRTGFIRRSELWEGNG